MRFIKNQSKYKKKNKSFNKTSVKNFRKKIKEYPFTKTLVLDGFADEWRKTVYLANKDLYLEFCRFLKKHHSSFDEFVLFICRSLSQTNKDVVKKTKIRSLVFKIMLEYLSVKEDLKVYKNAKKGFSKALARKRSKIYHFNKKNVKINKKLEEQIRETPEEPNFTWSDSELSEFFGRFKKTIGVKTRIYRKKDNYL